MPVDKEDKITELKANQETLSKQLTELEHSFSYPTLREQYDKELMDMVKVNLKQNQRNAERIEYALRMISELKEDETQKNIQKILVALGKAQVNLLDHLSKLHVQIDDLENNQIGGLEKSNKSLQDEISKLNETIDKLPYEQQINMLTKELETVLSEVKTFEDLVTTEPPEQLMMSINALKNDLEAIRNRTGTLQANMQKVKKSEGELVKIVPQVTKLGTLQVKIRDMENKMTNLSQLLNEQGKSKADQKTVKQILDSVSKTGQELDKMEKWFNTYPIGEAHELSLITQHFQDLENKISDLSIELQSKPKEHEVIKDTMKKMKTYEKEMGKKEVLEELQKAKKQRDKLNDKLEKRMRDIRRAEYAQGNI